MVISMNEFIEEAFDLNKKNLRGVILIPHPVGYN